MSKWKVLVCRPGLAGAELADSLGKIGVDARHGPTLEVEDLPLTTPSVHYDVMIFISPTAVSSSVARLPDFTKLADHLLAVGSGTGRDLNNLGVMDVQIPAQFNSEGLLAMPILQQVSGKNILIVKGRGGRPLLHQTLVERGANCDLLDVYDRRPASVEGDVWRWFWEGAKPRAITSASVETLAAFDTQRKASDKPLPDMLFVGSDRIAEAAEKLGYTCVMKVGGAANSFFQQAIESAMKQDRLENPDA